MILKTYNRVITRRERITLWALRKIVDICIIGKEDNQHWLNPLSTELSKIKSDLIKSAFGPFVNAKFRDPLEDSFKDLPKKF